MYGQRPRDMHYAARAWRAHTACALSIMTVKEEREQLVESEPCGYGGKLEVLHVGERGLEETEKAQEEAGTTSG